MTDPQPTANADQLAALRVVDAHGPLTPQDATEQYGVASEVMDQCLANDWVRHWIRAGEDTGMVQMSSAGWAQIQRADGPQQQA